MKAPILIGGEPILSGNRLHDGNPFPMPRSTVQPRLSPKILRQRTIFLHISRKYLPPSSEFFYRAASAQSAPFVKEGDVVNSGTTLCIVEAMKVMNEIKTPCRARIVKILAENTKPVAKNQPLFFVEPVD